MKRILLALAIMAMTLSVGAQTKKSTAKKTTTTATAKSKTTAKKTTSATSTKSTATKSKTTAKKTSTTTKKTTVTTPAKTKTTTTTTTTTSRPAGTVKEQHRETVTTYNRPKQIHHAANRGWNEAYHYFGGSFISAKYWEKVNGETNYEKKISGSAFRFTTGYNHAFPLAQSIPLYLRAGGAINFETGTKNLYDKEYNDRDAHYSKEVDKSEYDLTAYMLSLNMNVDCGYRIPLANGKLHIMPYLGGDLKMNLMGHATNGGDTYNIFSRDDMGDSETEGTIKRLQGGFHVGVDVFAIRHLVVGLQYQYYTPLFSYKDSYTDTYRSYTEDCEEGMKMSHSSIVLKAGFVW